MNDTDVAQRAVPETRATAKPMPEPSSRDSLVAAAMLGAISAGLAACDGDSGSADGMNGSAGNGTTGGGASGGDQTMCGRSCSGGSPATPTPTPGPGPLTGLRTFSFLGPNIAAITASTGVHATAAGPQSVWYFAGSGTVGNGFNGDRLLPSPVIEAVQGQTAQITLTSMMPHTLHPHGLDVNQANDGVPETSGFVGMRPMMGNFGRLPPGAVSLGTSFTYTFVAPFAGTYMYHCHVDTVLHMEMGLYGVVIVRPPDGSENRAWANGPTFNKEYVWVLHTMDTSWHTGGMMAASGPGTVRYRPNVFMINGRDGAALATDSTVAIGGAPGQVVLVRLVNPGYVPATVRFGGLSFDVIASDGRPLPAPIRAQSYDVAPGERYDVLLTLPAAGTRSATVTYQNIRGTGTLGTATTSVTAA
jgi:FtsP/CotA-like multicopper oxidase with cupredoxin domain